MQSPKPSSLQNKTVGIGSYKPTSVSNTDTAVGIFLNALDSLTTNDSEIQTVHTTKGSTELVSVENHLPSSIEGFADSLIASSQGEFKSWKLVTPPSHIASIYNKYGTWDKLYLLEHKNETYLAFNGKYLMVRKDG